MRTISEMDAQRMKLQLALREGLLVGISAGASVKIALDVARELGPGKTVVTIDRARRQVIAADGTVEGYDRLLLATGSVPVILPTARTPDVLLPAPNPGADSEAASSMELGEIVDRVRSADPRFGEVRAEVSNGRVTLSGRVACAEELIELGRALSQLPGVRHVDLRGVRIGR